MSAEKITRTVRLTPEVDARLRMLAEHLGTNVNAYLISEIGKAVSRDEIAFVAQRNQADFLAQIMSQLVESTPEKQDDMFKDEEA